MKSLKVNSILLPRFFQICVFHGFSLAMHRTWGLLHEVVIKLVFYGNYENCSKKKALIHIFNRTFC
jgi:hypothetical protein